MSKVSSKVEVYLERTPSNGPLHLQASLNRLLATIKVSVRLFRSVGLSDWNWGLLVCISISFRRSLYLKVPALEHLKI